MKNIVLVPLLMATASSSFAQLINGSFEDGMGNPDLSGWNSSCTMMPGPAAPGYGDLGVLVPHSNTGDCGGWSRAWCDVPTIADGETWTLSGWCGVFTFPFFSPYVGLRFGWREADGTYHANTAALTNNGTYTHLSVTNTFSLQPGDTVFIELEPGTASGMGSNQLFAMFDGLELTNLTTGTSSVAEQARVHLRPNPATDRLWLSAEALILEVRIVAADGRAEQLPMPRPSTTMELYLGTLAPGVYMVQVHTVHGIGTARVVKQ